MESEFIVVSGPLLGSRIPLGARELRLGRAPESHVRILEQGVAWEHCVVRAAEGRYRIADRRTGSGTYVNGMRITEQVLEPGDQVTIGETVLVYREQHDPGPGGTTNQALLRACSMIFLFRAMALARSIEAQQNLASQAVRLLGDLVPCTTGSILLGGEPAELAEAARQNHAVEGLAELIPAVCRQGGALDAERFVVALALYARGALAGVLAAVFPPAEATNLADHRDTLSAVATLAAAALEAARDVERLQTENQLLRERVELSETGIVGESIAIHKLLHLIARVAPQDTSVLILGESGTGKELVAHAIHRLSQRAEHPFVAINCAALTDTLLESELFGHEKGSFTGAVAQKKGKLETAEGGTVFLDEIGELKQPLQAKLLRVLQQREFERVGGTRTMRLDVRVVTATNRDLAAEAKRGTFREDLYHRLNVVSLRVPPLRERPGDILPLARYFLDRSAAKCGRRVEGFSPEAEQALLQYSWPGNVRELENAVERAVVLGDADVVTPEDLPDAVWESGPAALDSPDALQSKVVRTKREMILAAWEQSGGDHNEAAARLKIHPNSLRRLIRTLGLRDQLS